MARTHRRFFLATAFVAVMVTATDAQAHQGGRRGAPPGGGPGGGPAFPPLMQTPPKPAIPNVKSVRTCESLASVALAQTTIEQV
jgi:hypothetical protein